MKKHMIVGAALTMGLLSMGAFSASAAQACENCTQQQAMQQFTKETAGLTETLKAKNIQLRGLYGSDGFDVQQASRLEAEIRELKDKINASADKHGVSSCSRG